MPAWVTIYCTKAVADVAPESLLKGIEPSDYWTQAEQYQVNDELVDAALARLRIVQLGDDLELGIGLPASGNSPFIDGSLLNAWQKRLGKCWNLLKATCQQWQRRFANIYAP